MLLVKGLIFAVISVFCAVCATYPISIFFYIKKQNFRNVYALVLKEPGMKLVAEWEKIFDKKTIKTTIGIIIQITFFVVGFYVSFGFCAVYQSQQLTWLIICSAALIIDLLVFEIVVELFIAICYYYRKNSRFWLTTAVRLNTMRNFRNLH